MPSEASRTSASLTCSAACSRLSIPSACPRAGVRNVGRTGQNPQAQRAALLLNYPFHPQPASVPCAGQLEDHPSWPPNSLPRQEAGDEHRQWGRRDRMTSGAPQPRVLMPSCDFRHRHFSLSLSFLICGMGAVVALSTPSPEWREHGTALGKGKVLRK